MPRLPQPPKFSVPVAIIVTFACALFWANAKDPFTRIHFSLRSAGGEKTPGMVFLSKPLSKRPVVLYLYDSRENLQRSGLRLRQLAELGMAAVGIEYNQTNQTAFDDQFEALLDYIRKQAWANTNAVAWFGYGSGAQRLLSYAGSHPEIQPQLCIGLNGGTLDGARFGVPPSGGPAQAEGDNPVVQLPSCQFLLVHGRLDEVFPVNQCEKLAATLRGRDARVGLCILDGQGHHFGRDQDVVYRAIAEYAAAHFGLSGSRSTESHKSHWHYWIPALLLVFWFLWWACSSLLTWCFPCGAKLSRLAKVFYGVTAGVALVALGQTFLQLGLPSRAIAPETLALARILSVRQELRDDFDFLAKDSGWAGKPLRQLLQHVELASLQRKEFYENLSLEMYREFVLSPRIDADGTGEWGWRRQLWEAFYPRVRKESEPMAAVGIVVRFLRERVGISQTANGAGVEAAWKRGLTDSTGFEEIYVAALRAVGVAARLDGQGCAELWTGEKWITAPPPLVRDRLPFQSISSEREFSQ